MCYKSSILIHVHKFFIISDFYLTFLLHHTCQEEKEILANMDLNNPKKLQIGSATRFH